MNQDDAKRHHQSQGTPEKEFVRFQIIHTKSGLLAQR
jgi:hypothetical protein